MAINERLIHTAGDAGSSGNAEAEQGLILHLDANDVDSYDGDGTEWVDISTFEKTIPLSDNADDLEIHYDPSDISSYSGTGTTMTNLAGSSLDATVVAAEFDTDNGGFFDVSIVAQNTINVPNGHPLDGTGNSFTLEFWFNWKSAPSGGERFIYEASTGWNFFYYSSYGWRINNADCATGYFAANVATTAGEWNHFAMSQDASNCLVYINGTLVKTQAVTSGTRNIDSFSFGSTSLDGVNCKIGSIRMYSAALSASDIGQNYRHGRDTVYTELAGTPFLHYDPADTNSYSGTGTTFTDLAGNNNADLLGGIESGWDEELGNSFPITGSGDGITTSSPVSINPASGMTIEMWFKIDSDAQNYLFSFDGSETTYYGLSYRSNTDNVVFYYRTGSSSLSNIYSPTVTSNKWHHLVATTDGSGAQIYLDGVVGDTTTSNAYSYNYNEDLHFGNLYDLAQNSNTHIGQIRFYKGGLTADEVRQNYNFTKNNYPNGNNGTITGATWDDGGYFNFNGSDVINTTLDLNSANKGFTLTGWFRLSSSPNALNALFGDSNIVFGIVGSNVTGSVATESMWLYQNSPYISTWGTSALAAYADEGWHHIVVTAVGNSTSDKLFYVDGSLEAQFHQAGQGENWSFTDLRIGQSGLSSTYDFKGDIAEVKAFNRILTLDEIKTQFNLRCEEFGLTILP